MDRHRKKWRVTYITSGNTYIQLDMEGRNNIVTVIECDEFRRQRANGVWTRIP